MKNIYYKADPNKVDIDDECDIGKQIYKNYDVYSDPLLLNRIGSLIYTGILSKDYDSTSYYFGTSNLYVFNQRYHWTTCTTLKRNDKFIVT